MLDAFDAFDTLRHLTIVSIVIRFVMACVFGGIIGLERGRRQQAAGLRTHMMVCIGATSTMMVSEYMVGYYGSGDILRLGAQVISGIGFLGAGTIIVTKQNRIRGLTTAASLWASACMGLAIGAGFYEGALIMMCIMVFVLLILSRFDIKYVKSTAHVSLFVEMERDGEFGILLQAIKDQGWIVQEVRHMDFLHSEYLTLRIDLLSDEQIVHPKLCVEDLRLYDKIHYLDKM